MIPACLAGLAHARTVDSATARTGFTTNLALEPAAVHDAAAALYKAGYFLECISGADFAEGFEVLYTFDRFEKPERVALRTLAPHDAPVVPTIADIFHGALWHERECFDFYGVRFEGHPSLLPLLLPDDMELRPLVKAPEARKSREAIVFQTPAPPAAADSAGEKAAADPEAKAKAKAAALAKAKAKAAKTASETAQAAGGDPA